MAFLAQCAPERIPMTLVEGAIDDEAERREALAALAELSLVKHDPFEDGTPAVTVQSPRSGRRPCQVAGEGYGADCLDAPDRTALGSLSGRWLSQPRLMAALRAAHIASRRQLRDGSG
jgi:hypothetical protein